MATITDQISHLYQVRREVSKTVDLATLLLEHLLYERPARLPAAVDELKRRLQSGELEGLSGSSSSMFARWLREYLLVNRTVKGESFYPVHPILTLPDNGEGSRVDEFVAAVASCFTPAEREQLLEKLWKKENLPAFEGMLYDLIDWQVPSGEVAPQPGMDRFAGGSADPSANSPEGILVQTKEDLLFLVEETVGAQAYAVHAGRLLAFALSRYLLARAGLSLDLPIYAAPAADTHEGVKTLAHEIIEVHRAQFAEALRGQFYRQLEQTLGQMGASGDPPTEAAARQLVKDIFHWNANVVPVGMYAQLRREHGSFADIAYDYYWSQGYARNRFLRQLHATHLNLAKKAGYANSRSRYSQWHFYWLAPALVETLLLVSRSHQHADHILVADLLRDWRERYGIAVLIDSAWETVYRRHFRGLGSPESLNEANLRRFTAILAERGRLFKNSDDFPWVILRD